MTILDALKVILKDYPQGLTSKEAYEEIVKRELYSFPAQKPEHVVNGIIRRHCYGLDFPTAKPMKYFRIVSYREKKPRYALIALNHNNEQNINGSNGEINVNIEVLPEERIQKAYQEHLEEIYSLLMEKIMYNPPGFFEQLIVDLLLKMGYGYDADSAIVVGGSHDNGIDGVINEDRLGLDLIYLQAKRYDNRNKVGRPELQTFVGAMQNVQKGVFITTSNFTHEATNYAEHQQQKSLKLIDGKMLTKLMVKYEVGVKCQQKIKMFRLDTSYFE